MAKGYWICFYRSISNPAALAEYARLAGPAIQTGGGRFLARGTPAKIYEAGKDQRTVIIEFDTVKQATATYESKRDFSAVLCGSLRPLCCAFRNSTQRTQRTRR